MTVQQMFHEVQKYIVTLYDRMSGRADEKRKRYMRYIIGATTCLAIAVSCYGVWRWYIHVRERNAQKDLSFCLEEYFKEQRNANHVWQDLANRCARMADVHTNSYVYPYFKIIQADALVHANDLSAALEAMDVVYKNMRSSDPLYAMCMLKYRLMQLDSSEEAICKQGLIGLEALAHNQANIYADAARFYLGQYYRMHGQHDQSKQEWQELLVQRRAEPGMSSPWADLVASKVTQ